MRTSAHILKSLVVAWLCLASMVDLRSLPGFVLCFGEDGHIELEISVNDRCGTETVAGGMAAFSPQDADHCGECSDIPLFSQAMHSQSAGQASAAKPDFQPLGFLFSAPDFRYAPAQPAQPVERRAPPRAAASASLISLRTVRILV